MLILGEVPAFAEMEFMQDYLYILFIDRVILAAIVLSD